MSQKNSIDDSNWVAHPLVSTVIWLIGGNYTNKHVPKAPHRTKEKGLSWRDEQIGGDIADYIHDNRAISRNDNEVRPSTRKPITRKNSETNFIKAVILLQIIIYIY
jgi:hypothetical protein